MAWRNDAVILIFMLEILTVHCVVRKFDCLLKFKTHYTGTTAVTRKGYTCQRWDTKCPQTHTYADGDFPDVTKTAASNYCRNPKLEEKHPWCYIDDKSAPSADRWDFCHIPFCTQGTECTISPNGAEYLGKKTVAKNGNPCQRWDVQTPNTHTFTAANMDKFNEKTVKSVENYCRNFVQDEPNIWCYTIPPRWHLCDAPPTCQTTKICPNPPAVAHATQLTPITAGPYDHRATATYKCDKGYEFIDKYDGVECLLTKQWTEGPTCKKVKCPTLSKVPGSSNTVAGDPDEYGTTITYTCLKGYKKTAGDLTLACMGDKTWNGTVPVCTRIDCGSAPSVSGATTQSTTSTFFGGVARYKCNGDGLIYEKICKDDGKWDGNVCSGAAVGACPNTETCTCSPTTDVLKNSGFLAGVIVCSLITFFTVLGLSIAICKLRKPSLESTSTPTPRKPKTPPSIPRRQPRVRPAPQSLRPESGPDTYNHNYFRYGY